MLVFIEMLPPNMQSFTIAPVIISPTTPPTCATAPPVSVMIKLDVMFEMLPASALPISPKLFIVTVLP